MPKINPEIETFARIKVIGVGGSGTNTVNHMVNSKVKGVEFIAMNTDAQHLHRSLAEKKVHVGKNLTRGLGAGMDPEVGRKAAEESIEDIQNVIKGADMVFVSCGLGGGTGTGAAPVVARTAREQGALTVAVVTKPFFFEGKYRMQIAEQGLGELRQVVDAIITIPNDRVLSIVEKNTSYSSAFAMCDEVLRQAVEGISNTITTPGTINADFADIKRVMQNAGSALMGIGTGSGETRAVDAAKGAINSPLLDLSIAGAKGVLYTIAGGDDLTMFEIQEVSKIITESVDPDAAIIIGTIFDDKLKKNELRVTVIASGFPEAGNMPRRVNTFATMEPRPATPPVAKTTDHETDTPAAKSKETPEETGSLIKPPIRNVLDRTARPERPEVINPPESDKEDDWSSIPAFLRRSKKQ
jgi:cell division protein FtsZ